MNTEHIITLSLGIGILVLGFVLLTVVSALVRDTRHNNTLARTITQLMTRRATLNRLLWP